MPYITDTIREWSEDNPGLSPQEREYFGALNNVVFDPIVLPEAISGLEVWFDADQESYNNNDAVPTFNDQSGNSRDASQGTGSLQPVFKTNVVNGKPAVSFTGDDHMITTSFSIAQPHTAFIIHKQKNYLQGSWLINSPPAGFDWIVPYQWQTPETGIWAGNLIPGFDFGDDFGLFSAQVNGSDSYVRKNDEEREVGDSGPNGIVSGLRLSDNFSSPSYAEIILYSKVLTTMEEIGLLNYINNKYNLW